ncbi:uncharacterized protein LOC123565249 [Mercenaria mercenaria]|uniref:uncharacterized protein LOC123565249 n=1 Tax=Mercenaria mercenaria TaxID=6596 RepID=UPI00234F9E54|nr:uncharacterized protein LOC123565249 [Mercenaria mercenaria]
MATKLRYIQKGHKGAVTRLLSKFEAIQQEAVDYEDLQTIENALRQKQQTIIEIHEKILDSISEDDGEQIETEILEHDEYIYTLQTKIQKISSFKKVTLSNLNVNSPTFHAPVSGESSQTNHVHELHENVSHTNPASTLSHSSIYHRLPKLDLPKFDGNILDWQSFWDSYESAIHTNPSLSGVQKFNYLKSSLRGEAVQIIAGFSLTNINYDKAVSLLHERYGQRDKIIQTYMKALLEVPAPVYTVTSLRKFYDTTETYIRGLDSLGQNESTYGSLLTPVILQKLSPEVRTNITRAHGTQSWCLNDLMRCILNEVNILDAGNALNTPQEVFATASFLTKSDIRRPEKKNKEKSSAKYTKVQTCVYCKGEHSSTDCLKVYDREHRLNIVKEKQLCFNCLGSHKVNVCKSKFKCKICSRRHHTSLCVGESTAKPTDKSTEAHKAEKTNTSVLHSAHTFSSGPVLLKTAVSIVTSTCSSTTANILFDEGSQSSFVTEALAQKIQLQPTGSETLCLSGFGDRERRMRHLNTATDYLQTPKHKIPIKVLIVPEISVPLKTYQKHVSDFTYLKGITLAHPISEDEDFEIEMLIGADHYWSVVQDKIIRGNGPTAIQSRIGYLLSGPLYTENNPSPLPVSMMNIMTLHVQEELNLEKFWEVESMGVEQKTKYQGCDEYTRQYQDTCITYDNGQYVARLPWKDEHPSLPSNELISRRRIVSVVNRLRKEPELLQKYSEIINEQEQRRFVEKIVDDPSRPSTTVHYIPHHPVKKSQQPHPYGLYTTAVQAAFNLRSWSTNNQVLRARIESDGVSDKDKFTKVLGMRWDSTTDEMLFPQRSKMPMNDCLLTKREILKESSSIYDPLRLLSPLTVKGKILMQLL